MGSAPGAWGGCRWSGDTRAADGKRFGSDDTILTVDANRSEEGNGSDSGTTPPIDANTSAGDTGAAANGESNAANGTTATAGGTTVSTENNATAGNEENTSSANGTQSESNATDTEGTLQSLRFFLDATSLNKDHNTTVTLTGTYADGTQKDLSTQAQWIVSPRDAIKITGHTLTALKDVNVTLRAQVGDKLSNPVHLEIYWEVNGHRLPPEPDPKVNDSTLLGVDVNGNGVRDDVERKVYATYKKEIERAVMMQAFRTEQAMLADPDLVKHAREWAKKEDKVINCNEYLKWYKNQKRMRNIYKFVNNVQFNTEERVRKFFKYDQALSGGVYSVGDPILQDCEFDVEKVLEMDK